MPITDPFKLKIALEHTFRVKICRKCGAKNPLTADKCRRCRSKNLRLKRYKK